MDLEGDHSLDVFLLPSAAVGADFTSIGVLPSKYSRSKRAQEGRVDPRE